jgi:hypothetical protein
MGDEFESVAEIGRRMKMDEARRFGDDADEYAADLVPFVVVVRNGIQMAQVVAGPGPDGPREACYWAAAVMRPHELYVIADARISFAVPEEPEQGQITEAWHAGRRDGITECMAIMRIPALGNATQTVYPYERKGKQIRWLEPMSPDKSEGAMIDYARAGFSQGRELFAHMLEAIPQDTFEDMGLDERNDTIDRAAARFVSSNGPMVCLMLPGQPTIVYVEAEEVPNE